MKKQLSKNVIVNTISVIWRMLIGFVIMPLMVKNLHQDGYGVWVLVVSFTIFGYLNIVEFGIGTSVIKFVAEHIALKRTDKINQTISAALIFYFGLGILSAIGLLIFKDIAFFKLFKIPKEFIRPTNILLYMMALKAIIDFPTQAISSALEGFQRYDIWRSLEILRDTLQAIATVILLFSGKGLVELGMLLLGISIFNLISCIITVKHLFPPWRLIIKVPYEIIRNMAIFSSKIFAIRINAIVYNGMDKVIISTIIGVGALTNYAIAQRIQSLGNTAMSLVSLVLVPTASMLFALKDIPKLQQTFIRATKYTMALCVPLTLALMILAKPLIYYWIGQEYVYIYRMARLFLSYLLVYSIVPVAYNMLIGIGKIGALLRIQIISTLINLLISIFITYKIGITGVIWGTIIGTSFAIIPYLSIALKTFKLKWTLFLQGTTLKVYPASFLSAGLLLIFSKIAPPHSIIEVGMYFAGFEIIFFSIFIILGLDKIERNFVIDNVRLQISSIKHSLKK
ncbi:MAG: oligosaccharide flippase family protein [bacterium]